MVPRFEGCASASSTLLFLSDGNGEDAARICGKLTRRRATTAGLHREVARMTARAIGIKARVQMGRVVLAVARGAASAACRRAG
jgi:hypothetical protein